MYHTSENLTSLTSTCCCFRLDNGVFRGLDYFHNGYTGLNTNKSTLVTNYGVDYPSLLRRTSPYNLHGLRIGYKKLIECATRIRNNLNNPTQWGESIDVFVVMFPQSGRFVWMNDDLIVVMREQRDIIVQGRRYGYMAILPHKWGPASEAARSPTAFPGEHLKPPKQLNEKTPQGCEDLVSNRAYARAAILIVTISHFPHHGDEEGFVGGGDGDGGGGDGGGYGDGSGSSEGGDGRYRDVKGGYTGGDAIRGDGKFSQTSRRQGGDTGRRFAVNFGFFSHHANFNKLLVGMANLSYYYGKFHRSSQHKIWTNYWKKRARKFFLRGWRRHENLSRLLIEDNSGGMTTDKMCGCMSLGYSEKSKLANTIGQYGNGFKTSTMRLGADVLVFTRNRGQEFGRIIVKMSSEKSVSKKTKERSTSSKARESLTPDDHIYVQVEDSYRT